MKIASWKVEPGFKVRSKADVEHLIDDLLRQGDYVVHVNKHKAINIIKTPYRILLEVKLEIFTILLIPYLNLVSVRRSSTYYGNVVKPSMQSFALDPEVQNDKK